MNTTENTTEINATACNCGCKTPVGKKSIYRPGHDAKHVSIVIDGLWNHEDWCEGTSGDCGSAVDMTIAAYNVFPTAALKAKFVNALSRKVDKEWSKYCTASLSKSAKIREQASCQFGWHPDEYYFGLSDNGIAPGKAPAKVAAPATVEAPTPAKTPQEVWEFEVTDTTPEPEITADGGEIKVGRWTYPTGSVAGGDVTYRNTKRDGSGEWVETN